MRHLNRRSVFFAAGLLMTTAAGAHAAPDQPARPGSIDRILIEKAKHRMTLYQGETAVRTYRVHLGRGGLPPKTREGDGRTPEGEYIVDSRNENSKFHLALHISYPTAAQKAAAAAKGESAGGDIMIHGRPNGAIGAFVFGDWTNGCIAVNDREIEEIWSLVGKSARVTITP